MNSSKKDVAASVAVMTEEDAALFERAHANFMRDQRVRMDGL